MKQGVLLAVFLVSTIFLGCTPKAPVTLSPKQEAPPLAATESPVSTEAAPTAAAPPSLTPSESPTTPAPATTTPSPQTPPTTTQTRALPPLDAFMKGIHLFDWMSYNPPEPPTPLTKSPPPSVPPPPGSPPKRGLYAHPETDQSLRNLAATGSNWVGFQVNAGQETIASTSIFRDSPATATDSELLRIINLAHSLGMRVMLRTGLGLSDDPDHFSGHIGTVFTTEAQWQEWFDSYRDYVNHYATLSQEAGVDMLCIGVEMGGVTHREEDWRRVIQEVRQRYKGAITYSSLCVAFAGISFPWGEVPRIKWWDAVDYIGVNGYNQLTDKNDPTVAELKAAWTDRGHIVLLESLSRQYNKPIVITEIGYESKDGANRWPGWGGKDRQGPVDLQEQADCYQATLEVLWGKPWLAGIFWFQWDVSTSKGGPNSDTYTPYGKPAEEVLKKFFLSQ